MLLECNSINRSQGYQVVRSPVINIGEWVVLKGVCGTREIDGVPGSVHAV